MPDYISANGETIEGITANGDTEIRQCYVNGELIWTGWTHAMTPESTGAGVGYVPLDSIGTLAPGTLNGITVNNLGQLQGGPSYDWLVIQLSGHNRTYTQLDITGVFAGSAATVTNSYAYADADSVGNGNEAPYGNYTRILYLNVPSSEYWVAGNPYRLYWE